MSSAQTPALPDCVSNGNAIKWVWESKNPKPFEQTVGIPIPGCRIPVTIIDEEALPSRRAGFGWRLLAQSTTSTTLLRIQVWKPAQQRKTPLLVAASDVARADQLLMLPGQIGEATIQISRHDLSSKEPASVRLQLSREKLDGLDDKSEHSTVRASRRDLVFLQSLASAGHAFRTELTEPEYQRLIDVAKEYGNRRQSSPKTKASAFAVISQLVGRRIESADPEIASRTEPMVVFLGLAGLNRMMLMDCLQWPMPAAVFKDKTEGDCKRISEPWQTTLERAEHVWAIYIEDEQAAFDTSIDVEFGRTERTPVFEEFDPQNSVRVIDELQTKEGAEGRRVRIGFRRLAVPTKLDVIKVTFNRQGPSYGLRSWSREYVRYGNNFVRLAGGVAVPAEVITRSQLVLEPVYGADPLSPVAVELVEEKTHHPILAMGFVRFPAFQQSAKQANSWWASTWRLLLPDAALGIGLPLVEEVGWKGQNYVLGASWPIYGDRVHFLFAGLKTRTVTPTVPIGQRLPVGTDVGTVGVSRKDWQALFGVSIDLARSR